MFNSPIKAGVVQKWHGKPYRFWHRGVGNKYLETSEIFQGITINVAQVDAADVKGELVALFGSHRAMVISPCTRREAGV